MESRSQALTTLRLERVGLNVQAFLALVQVIGGTSLTSLIIEDAAVALNRADAEYFARRLPPTLTSLALSNMHFESAGFALFVVNFPPRLENLTINQILMGDDGARALAQHMSRKLTSLSVHQCGITDEGFAALVPRLPATLQSLDLGGNLITRAGIQHCFKQIPSPRGRGLIGWLNLGKANGAVTANWLPKSLEVLKLGSCGFNEADAKVIVTVLKRAAPGLKRLDLSGNGLDVERAPRADGLEIVL
ncbi:hypothetical protein H9P43_004435 [Blastocladiella emersonii ATCC 22665]|nr:hypothetical protein H9P43_004435 [Blastocladiella emersonii ATCC 22665]